MDPEKLAQQSSPCWNVLYWFFWSGYFQLFPETLISTQQRYIPIHTRSCFYFEQRQSVILRKRRQLLVISVEDPVNSITAQSFCIPAYGVCRHWTLHKLKGRLFTSHESGLWQWNLAFDRNFVPTLWLVSCITRLRSLNTAPILDSVLRLRWRLSTSSSIRKLEIESLDFANPLVVGPVPGQKTSVVPWGPMQLYGQLERKRHVSLFIVERIANSKVVR